MNRSFFSVFFTQLIAQNDLLSAKQQPYVFGRILAWSSTNPSARKVSGVFLAQMDIPIQVWHMVDVMRGDFNEHQMTQVPITEKQLGTMQMMEEVSEHVGVNYTKIPDSRYVAQPVDDFLFPWEEEGSVELSKRMRGSLNHQDNQQRWRQDQFCT